MKNSNLMVYLLIFTFSFSSCTVQHNSNQRAKSMKGSFENIQQSNTGYLWQPDIDIEAENANMMLRGMLKNGKQGEPVLDNFSFPELKGEIRTRFLRHLTSSAKWQVTFEDQKIIVRRRVLWQKEWLPHQTNEYEDDPTQVYWATSIAIAPDGLPFKSLNDAFIFNVADQKPIRIPQTHSSDKPYTHLILESGKTELEVIDASPYSSRICTNIALNNLKAELNAVQDSVKIDEQGYDPALIPKASIFIGKPQLKLREGFQKGLYSAEGYINPGEPGFIYLKAFDAIQRTPLLIDNGEPNRTIEYTGWSANPKVQFFFGSPEFAITGGKSNSSYPAIIEIWFHGNKSQVDRKLSYKLFTVDNWER